MSVIDGASTATPQTCGAERDLKRAGKVEVDSSLEMLSSLNSSACCFTARARPSTNTPFPTPVANISPNSLIPSTSSAKSSKRQMRVAKGLEESWLLLAKAERRWRSC